MTLIPAADHRSVNGVAAGRFLHALKTAVERFS
jgi:hypothetical protein